MSQFRVSVVPVALEPHPDAHSLSIVRVGGWQVVVRTADWTGVDRGAYLEPDSVVPDRPGYQFLRRPGSTGDRWRRIRVARLRGVLSQGLLVRAPDGAAIGDDVAEDMGVTHYQPPESQPGTGGESALAPRGYYPVYDVESLRRYPDLFEAGEVVEVTEKIHGASARYLFDGETLHVGSRTEWKREDSNLWWRALRATPTLEPCLRAHPGLAIYGEVYGQVQDLKYGAGKGEVRFAAFDALRNGQWLDPEGFALLCQEAGVPRVPIVCVTRFTWEGWDIYQILDLADGESLIPGADHIREGIVIRPLIARTDPRIGRVIAKVVSDAYLERA